ncbi:LacI family DNA-binding transcriptional regulator [Roseomonas sp. NAR14]|uniref:LacI family DNA-binding transcriptional regulator n=1 Tax=Roseomonas acroporae TaxID=2937791 RepID=A0A9X1YFE9_9PROT|nr:LacI family DNA-binding transcriptional regulator [Roseomonas acroporae]MCK8787667.1 LacI family DNA-binding transcriptional regulator [Roseomonas acroporae]
MPDDAAGESAAPGRTIRMRDVARAAGVSTMTVSRALSSPEKVSEEVRRRVEAAVSAIGYVPNRLAGNLSSSRSDVVGLIVPSLENSLFSSTIQGIATVLRRNGYQLMVADCGYSQADEEALIAAFLEQRVAGLVLHNTSHSPRAREMIRRAGVPVVENGTLVDDPLDMVVSYSNEGAARAMTLHLARLGYRRLGFVCLPTATNDRSVARQRGYRAALREAGLPLDPALMLEMPPGLGAGAEAVVRLAEEPGRADAIFFAGDVMAIGALFECQRRGWAVPGRVGIAAFDDFELLGHTVPTVTTLRLPRLEIGRRSAQVLLDRIQGRSTGKLVVDLKFEIIHREST